MTTKESAENKSESSKKTAPRAKKAGNQPGAASTSSSMSAVVRFRGEQFSVAPGQKLTINRLDVEPGQALVFEEVLLVSASNEGQQTTLVGTPLVSGAKVTAKILSHDKGSKVIIYKKKRRTGYTKSQGHRQLRTHLMIEEIVASR